MRADILAPRLRVRERKQMLPSPGEDPHPVRLDSCFKFTADRFNGLWMTFFTAATSAVALGSAASPVIGAAGRTDRVYCV